MTGDELDEVTAQKILGAAEEIKGMAKVRPADAPAMLEQARHLIELAEQIKSDWQRRQHVDKLLDRANTRFVEKPPGERRDAGALLPGHDRFAVRSSR